MAKQLTLKELHELTRKFLEERPELAETKIVDIAGATMQNIALHDGLIYLNCFEETTDTTEVLWQQD